MASDLNPLFYSPPSFDKLRTGGKGRIKRKKNYL